MKRLSFNSDHIFLPALVCSALVHVALITANAWLPGSADFSVNNAPNSLEFTVVSQPSVSIIEEEIITEEIIDQNTDKQVVFKEEVKKEKPVKKPQPSISSQQSLGAVTKAKPLMHNNPAPSYPKLARQRGWEGTVRLNVLVEKDGNPQSINIQQSSGHAVLDKSAVNAVKQWKFSPAQSGNIQFSSKIIIPIQFALVKQEVFV